MIFGSSHIFSPILLYEVPETVIGHTYIDIFLDDISLLLTSTIDLMKHINTDVAEAIASVFLASIRSFCLSSSRRSSSSSNLCFIISNFWFSRSSNSFSLLVFLVLCNLFFSAAFFSTINHDNSVSRLHQWKVVVVPYLKNSL